MNQVQKKSLRKKLFKPALHLLSEIAVNGMYTVIYIYTYFQLSTLLETPDYIAFAAKVRSLASKLGCTTLQRVRIFSGAPLMMTLYEPCGTQHL